ncbi:hypothetical protein Tco_0686023 [Tanacetum coccineum]
MKIPCVSEDKKERRVSLAPGLIPGPSLGVRIVRDICEVFVDLELAIRASIVAYVLGRLRPGLSEDPIAFKLFYNFKILHARWAMLAALLLPYGSFISFKLQVTISHVGCIRLYS